MARTIATGATDRGRNALVLIKHYLNTSKAQTTLERKLQPLAKGNA